MHNTHTEKMGKQCASELPVQNLKRHIKERRRDSKFKGYDCFERLACTSSFRRSIVHNLKRPKYMLCCGPGGALSKTKWGNLQPSRHSRMQLPSAPASTANIASPTGSGGPRQFNMPGHSVLLSCSINHLGQGGASTMPGQKTGLIQSAKWL